MPMMNSKTVRAVGIVVSVVAGIFVLACGQAVEKEVGEDEHANSRADLLAHQWSEREVAGLFVLTPSAFREQQLQLPQMLKRS